MRISIAILAGLFLFACQKAPTPSQEEGVESKPAVDKGAQGTANEKTSASGTNEPAKNKPEVKEASEVATAAAKAEKPKAALNTGACGGGGAAAGVDGVAPAQLNCGGGGEEQLAESAVEAKGSDAVTRHFGGAFTLDDSVGLSDVLAASPEFTGKNIKVRGYISKVCKKKGCWFTVSSKAGDSTFVRITMKDYGFFVPLDCDGKTAVIEGVFTERVVAESMRKHLAEDGGDDPTKVKGVKKEFTMVATAIDIEG